MITLGIAFLIIARILHVILNKNNISMGSFNGESRTVIGVCVELFVVSFVIFAFCAGCVLVTIGSYKLMQAYLPHINNGIMYIIDNLP